MNLYGGNPLRLLPVPHPVIGGCDHGPIARAHGNRGAFQKKKREGGVDDFDPETPFPPAVGLLHRQELRRSLQVPVVSVDLPDA